MRPDRPHLALVGLSGSGKSTLAPMLASRLGGFTAVDLDRVVEARFGCSVADVFAQQGEATFRDAESEALGAALDGPPAVVATGGGVILDPGNRRLLAARATVVWLRAHPSQLNQRLAGTSEARPLLDGDAEFALTRLSEERAALYAQVADLTVDVDGVDPRDLADELAASLG